MPFVSDVPMSVKKAIVDGELCRLKRTSRVEADLRAQMAFFRKKLINRGFPNCFIQDRIDAFERRCTKPVPAANAQLPILPLKFDWCHGMQCLRIRDCLTLNRHLLCEKSIAKLNDFKTVVCFKAAPTPFRMRFCRYFD